jgi:hypothetical protein
MTRTTSPLRISSDFKPIYTSFSLLRQTGEPLVLSYHATLSNALISRKAKERNVQNAGRQESRLG